MIDFTTLTDTLYTGPSGISGTITLSKSIADYRHIEVEGYRPGSGYVTTLIRGVVINRDYSLTIGHRSGSVITFYNVVIRFISNTQMQIISGGAIALSSTGIAGFGATNETVISTIVGIK